MVNEMKRNMRRDRGILFLVVVGLLGSLSMGCATGRMESARQLEDGERQVALMLDVPGPIFSSDGEAEFESPLAIGPMGGVGMSWMRGIGNLGDVSAYAGVGVFALDVGLGGRVYLGEDFTAGVMVDMPISLVSSSALEPLGVLFTGRLTTTAKEGRALYGGLFTTMMTGSLAPRPLFGQPRGGEANPERWGQPFFGALLVGGMLGFDTFTPPGDQQLGFRAFGQGLQVELQLNVLGIHPDAGAQLMFMPQIKVGGYRSYGG